METIIRTEASLSGVENELSGLTAPNVEAEKQGPSQKVSGLHKITPCTVKSLKTTFDQTSGHCREFGSLWKAGRLARGSVNCLRIFREITLILPRVSVAFGNDLAEHFLNFLEKLADRFDGKHEIDEGAPAKRKPKWLAIVFMLCVLMYGFNTLKSFSSVNINLTPSSKKEGKETNEARDGKVEKAVATALAKKFDDEADNDVGDVAAKDKGSASNAEDLQVGTKSKLSKKELKTALKQFVTEVLDSSQ